MGQPFDELLRLGDLTFGELDLFRFQLGRVSDRVGPAHRVQNDDVVADPEQTEALTAAPGEKTS